MQRQSKEYFALRQEYDVYGESGAARLFAQSYAEVKYRVRYRLALCELMNAITNSEGLTLLDEVMNALRDSPIMNYKDIKELYRNVLDRCYSVSLEALQNCISDISDTDKLLPWIRSLNLSDCTKLMKSIKLPENSEMLKKLLKCAMENDQVIFLLVADTKNIISQVSPEIVDDNKEFFRMIRTVNSIQDEDYRTFSIDMLYQFYKEFGKINEHGVVLSLAALCEDGKITPPTLILHGDEDKYFTSLKAAKPPYVERFIYFDICHWLSGEISVDSDGHMKVLLIDSLGVESRDVEGNIRRVEFGEELLFATVKFDKNADIYLTREKRQNSEKGCSMYAIDDIRHLETMSKYIDSSKYPDGLFDYLKSHSKSERLENNIRVHKANLPLRLLRTMQSRKMLQLMTNSTESDLPLNKKGTTGLMYANNPPGFFADDLGELRNRRLYIKLDNTLQRNLNFLMHNSYQVVKLKMAEFGIDGLKKRITTHNQHVTRESGM